MSPSHIARLHDPSATGLQSGKPKVSSSAATTLSKSTQDDAAEPSQEHFRLLDLPPELVVRVLEHATIKSSKERPLDIKSTSAVQPAITRACRWLRAEGLKLFYTRNDFMFTGTARGIAAFRRWRAAIGGGKSKMIDYLSVKLVTWDGRSVDLEKLPWNFWLEEVEFLKDMMAKGKVSIYVRTIDEKVVMFPCHEHPKFERYQISFKDHSEGGGGWRALGSFPPRIAEGDHNAADARMTDWWARPS